MIKANVAAEAQDFFKYADEIAADFGIEKTAERLAEHWIEHKIEMLPDGEDWSEDEMQPLVDAMTQELIKLGLPSEA